MDAFAHCAQTQYITPTEIKMWIPSTRLLTPTSLRNIPNPRMHTNPPRISCVALQTVAVGEQDVSFTCLIYGFAHKCAEWNHMGNPIVHGEQRMDPSQMVYWVMGAMLFGIDAQANPCFTTVLMWCSYSGKCDKCWLANTTLCRATKARMTNMRCAPLGLDSAVWALTYQSAHQRQRPTAMATYIRYIYGIVYCICWT